MLPQRLKPFDSGKRNCTAEAVLHPKPIVKLLWADLQRKQKPAPLKGPALCLAAKLLLEGRHVGGEGRNLVGGEPGNSLGMRRLLAGSAIGKQIGDLRS